jgi:hypothetical protein
MKSATMRKALQSVVGSAAVSDSASKRKTMPKRTRILGPGPALSLVQAQQKMASSSNQRHATARQVADDDDEGEDEDGVSNRQSDDYSDTSGTNDQYRAASSDDDDVHDRKSDVDENDDPAASSSSSDGDSTGTPIHSAHKRKKHSKKRPFASEAEDAYKMKDIKSKLSETAASLPQMNAASSAAAAATAAATTAATKAPEWSALFARKMIEYAAVCVNSKEAFSYSFESALAKPSNKEAADIPSVGALVSLVQSQLFRGRDKELIFLCACLETRPNTKPENEKLDTEETTKAYKFINDNHLKFKLQHAHFGRVSGEWVHHTSSADRQTLTVGRVSLKVVDVTTEKTVYLTAMSRSARPRELDFPYVKLASLFAASNKDLRSHTNGLQWIVNTALTQLNDPSFRVSLLTPEVFEKVKNEKLLSFQETKFHLGEQKRILWIPPPQNSKASGLVVFLPDTKNFVSHREQVAVHLAHDDPTKRYFNRGVFIPSTCTWAFKHLVNRNLAIRVDELNGILPPSFDVCAATPNRLSDVAVKYIERHGDHNSSNYYSQLSKYFVKLVYEKSRHPSDFEIAFLKFFIDDGEAAYQLADIPKDNPAMIALKNKCEKARAAALRQFNLYGPTYKCEECQELKFGSRSRCNACNFSEAK